MVPAMKKTLYNGESDRCCAFCKRHGVAMTVKQMKKKECLKVNCWHLVKYPEHPYWQYRESVKRNKKKRKEAQKAYLRKFGFD